MVQFTLILMLMIHQMLHYTCKRLVIILTQTKALATCISIFHEHKFCKSEKHC